MHNFSQLVLHHESVTIRRIYETDLPALFAVYGDPAVMHFASDPPFTTMAMMEQFYASVLAGYTSGDYYELAIVFDQTAIGTCSLHGFTPDGHQVEIGYLLHRGYWRRGIMSNVLTLLVSYLFRQLPIMQVVADIDAENLPSRRLVTKLGFQPLPGSTTLFVLPRPPVVWPSLSRTYLV